MFGPQSIRTFCQDCSCSPDGDGVRTETGDRPGISECPSDQLAEPEPGRSAEPDQSPPWARPTSVLRYRTVGHMTEPPSSQTGSKPTLPSLSMSSKVNQPGFLTSDL